MFLFSLYPRIRGMILRFRHYLLPVLGVIVFCVLIYLAREQFLYWQGNEFSKAFLPPLNPDGISYFLSFIFFKLFAGFILSLVGAYIFLFCALKLNERYEQRFFYEDELYFGAAGAFLIGYPGLIYYLFLFFGAYLALQVISMAYFRESKRITPYYLWLPLSLLLITLQYFFGSSFPYLSILVI